MTSVNEAEHEAICNDIREMHETADMLLNPPGFNQDLYLSSHDTPNALEVDEFDKLYSHY